MAARYSIPDFLVEAGRPHRALERRVIATGRPGLRLRFYPDVPEDAREMLKAFARWLRGEIGFRHPVQVTVVPQATVMGHDGAPGWAVFLIPPPDYHPGDLVRIYVAAGRVGLLEARYGLGRGEALRRVAHDLAHEVVHYEQWRDGRAITERNVNRRAAALTRRFLAARPLSPRPRRPAFRPRRARWAARA